jgi:hypothetical protein
MSAKNKLEEITLADLRRGDERWTTVKRAAAEEGITEVRIYQLIHAGRRKAVRFAGVTLVVPAPRRRKLRKRGRPRVSEKGR